MEAIRVAIWRCYEVSDMRPKTTTGRPRRFDPGADCYRSLYGLLLRPVYRHPGPRRKTPGPAGLDLRVRR
jgi:hypothetical protein